MTRTGKGALGPDELVKRIEATGLRTIVAHQTLILPQLGAPGVAAHEVKNRTGFRMVYPVRSADLLRFLDADLQADSSMRRVSFTLHELLAVCLW